MTKYQPSNIYAYMCTENKFPLDSSIMGEGNFSLIPYMLLIFSKFPIMNNYYVNMQEKNRLFSSEVLVSKLSV